MDALAALTSRTSPIKLREPGPTGASLEAILAAGLRAPDHGRMRPWRFLLIAGEARRQFGRLLADSVRRREPAASEAAIQRESDKALRAPLLIVVAACPKPNPKVPEVEQIISAGTAAQNILVAAHALGFGGFWRTGEAAYDPQVKSALGLAAADSIVAVLYVGTVEVAAPAKRPDPAGVVREWHGG